MSALRKRRHVAALQNVAKLDGCPTRGAAIFRQRDRLSRYGLVVVVVVVSSRLIIVAGWVSTTFRTTTRSPTVE